MKWVTRARSMVDRDYQDDHELLERELPVYDALYAYCRGRVARAGS
jgi:hypothetical protein